jgi:hypothetical protein
MIEIIPAADLPARMAAARRDQIIPAGAHNQPPFTGAIGEGAAASLSVAVVTPGGPADAARTPKAPN